MSDRLFLFSRHSTISVFLAVIFALRTDLVDHVTVVVCYGLRGHVQIHRIETGPLCRPHVIKLIEHLA